VCAAIALQEPARLLQHLFYFIAHETTPDLTQRILPYLQFLFWLYNNAVKSAQVIHIYFLHCFDILTVCFCAFSDKKVIDIIGLT